MIAPNKASNIPGLWRRIESSARPLFVRRRIQPKPSGWPGHVPVDRVLTDVSI